MQLHLSSEQVSPTGNAASTGILNQLGRPDLETLAVLVREAVQNSWDARRPNTLPVRFGISGWTLNASQRQALQDEVFVDYPPEHTLPLVTHIHAQSDFHVLSIYDQGTTGLGGPTRADVVTSKQEPRNFVDFLRDIGHPPERPFSGGTYGYGKAAFYRASQVSTICVYTCCQYKHTKERRFIAAALGKPYTTDTARFTGRHWWGRFVEGIIEPILNDEADDLAARLGMSGFDGDKYGTKILVLQPTFEEEPSQTIDFLVDNLLYYFWPKMLTYGDEPAPMTFEVSWEGIFRDIPHPLSFPPLRGFALAMYHLKGINADQDSPFRFKVTDIASQRPAQHLGQLALQQFPKNIYPQEDDNQPNLFRDLTNHTALMRQPELVVKYLPGTMMPNEQLGYAGVFLTNPDLDTVFADSEPPTHDNWVPKSLSNRRHKIFVNVAMRNIEREMETFAKPPAVGGAAHLTPLGEFANSLGSSLIPSIQGPAATFLPGSSSGSPRSVPSGGTGITANRANIRILSEGEFVIVNNTPALQVQFAVAHAQDSAGTVVTVYASAVLDGAQPETDPPVGGSQPQVLCWTAPDETEYPGSESLFIPSQSQESWLVAVSVPEDMMLRVDMQAEPQALQ